MKKVSIFFFLAILSVLSSCQKKQHKTEEEATFLVTVPLRLDTLVFKDYVSQIRAIQHIEIRALEKGYLQNIYVDEGQFVKKGQLMFQIMPLIYQAETQKAQAEVNFVEIEYQNTKSLADSNIVSKNELALAKAKLDKAKAELALSRAHLGFTEVRAPFDGIMDRFQVRLGSLVDEGELLTTLSDNSKMWVYFNVPEAEYLDYATRAKSKNPLNVKLRMANNELFEEGGKVETIEADFDNETGNIAFRATFPNPKKILRHGETGNVLMPVVLKNSLLIPQKATFEILDKKFLYVVDDKGIVHSRQITVGTELPHLYAVTSGLRDGEKVLIEGLRKVKNKQKIKCQTENPRKVFAEMNQLFAE
ncbi:efflux RND transporter periplasmic adaptor subunit [Haliscomenobacter sp.]|uniref:efflux RND transporter periplasmic adaptor subunit n=1 Tax=Haliscomenobacter sp. TaxID=2717303 RepID=UPI003BA9CABA